MDKYFNEEGFRIMKEYMVLNNIPHTSVKPVPFLNIFVPEDINDYSDATYEKYFDKNIPTMSFGSYALAQQLIDEGYTPGGFLNENMNIQTQMSKWGSDNFLNGNCVFTTMGEIEFETGDKIANEISLANGMSVKALNAHFEIIAKQPKVYSVCEDATTSTSSPSSPSSPSSSAAKSSLFR